jgi:hypothetical protein
MGSRIDRPTGRQSMAVSAGCWRGGRAVECASLLKTCPVKSWTAGSNPALSVWWFRRFWSSPRQVRAGQIPPSDGVSDHMLSIERGAPRKAGPRRSGAAEMRRPAVIRHVKDVPPADLLVFRLFEASIQPRQEYLGYRWLVSRPTPARGLGQPGFRAMWRGKRLASLRSSAAPRNPLVPAHSPARCRCRRRHARLGEQ